MNMENYNCKHKRQTYSVRSKDINMRKNDFKIIQASFSVYDRHTNTNHQLFEKTTIIQQRSLVRYHSMQVEEEQQRKATYNLTNLVNELLQLV